MALPVIHHRTPQFGAVLAEVQEGLRELFGTAQDVLVLAASGTGAMEGSVTNLLSPGDQVLVVNGGKFGERWTKICQAYGLTVREVVVEWGRAVRPEAVKAALDEHPRVRALFVQASETSTCALHPVPALAEITRRRDVLLVVDGITAVGVFDLPMDRLGIDVLVTGSQKALMLPPGLAFVALSERAWKATETARLPRFYFDFRRERKGVAERSTAWTPAISLIQGLRVALQLLRAEGWANVHARHDRLARATRAAATALGLRLLAPESPSPAATAVMLPEGLDGTALFGYVDAFDVVTGVAALELALHRFGAPVELGRGVGAAERILAEGLPARG